MAGKNSFDVTKVTRIGLLIAVEIVLSRLLSISTPITKIGFAFIPLSIIGMLYGPIWRHRRGALRFYRCNAVSNRCLFSGIHSNSIFVRRNLRFVFAEWRRKKHSKGYGCQCYNQRCLSPWHQHLLDKPVYRQRLSGTAADKNVQQHSAYPA